MEFLDNSLKRKSQKLSYGKVIHTVANNIMEYDLNKKNMNEKLLKMKRLSLEFSKDIKKSEKTSIGRILPHHYAFHWLYLNHRVDKDENFLVTKTCTGCGTCSKICPLNNIVLENGTPSFRGHCDVCVACMQWCPQKAIHGNKRVKNRTQFHNPDIRLSEMFYRKKSTIN
ncbi:hypothetical protein IGI44_003509 [Enterococcus sp. DIV0756]